MSVLRGRHGIRLRQAKIDFTPQKVTVAGMNTHSALARTTIKTRLRFLTGFHGFVVVVFAFDAHEQHFCIGTKSCTGRLESDFSPLETDSNR